MCPAACGWGSHLLLARWDAWSYQHLRPAPLLAPAEMTPAANSSDPEVNVGAAESWRHLNIMCHEPPATTMHAAACGITP